MCNSLNSWLSDIELDAIIAPTSLGTMGMHFGVPHGESILMRNGGHCAHTGKLLLELLVPPICSALLHQPGLEMHEAHPLSVVRLLGLIRDGQSFVQFCISHGFASNPFKSFEDIAKKSGV